MYGGEESLLQNMEGGKEHFENRLSRNGNIKMDLNEL